MTQRARDRFVRTDLILNWDDQKEKTVGVIQTWKYRGVQKPKIK